MRLTTLQYFWYFSIIFCKATGDLEQIVRNEW